MKKADKEFAKKLDFRHIKFPVKIRDKIEKKNYVGISAFGYESKVKYPMYQKNILKINMLINYWHLKEKEKHYVLIKDFSTSMYDHILYRGRVKALKVIVNKLLRCLKRVNVLNSRIVEEK